MVRSNEVLIVDEFTGRLMPGRRYSDGLHGALEAKEHVEAYKSQPELVYGNTLHTYSYIADEYAGRVEWDIDQLMMNKHGRVVSKKKHNTAKRDKRLVKAGFHTRKGHFGWVKRDGSKSRKSKRSRKTRKSKGRKRR